MTTTAPPGARTLAVLTASAALLLWLVPLLAAAATPDPQVVVGSGKQENLPDRRTAVRFTAPAGWVEKEAPVAPERPYEYARGAAEMKVFAARDVADPDVYTQRLMRLAGAQLDVTGVPDGAVRGPDGLAGPRLRLTGSDGRRGELLVLGRGGTAAAVLVLAPAGEQADVRPVVDSLRVAS